jgi:hypothetical protein
MGRGGARGIRAILGSGGTGGPAINLMGGLPQVVPAGFEVV